MLPSAPQALKGKTEMRTLIAGFALATVALLLGGCAGGGFGGNSALPSAGIHQINPLDSVGGGPSLGKNHAGPRSFHSLDSVGGGPSLGKNHAGPRSFHSLDSVGGGPSLGKGKAGPRTFRSLDSVGGGPTVSPR